MLKTLKAFLAISSLILFAITFPKPVNAQSVCGEQLALDVFNCQTVNPPGREFPPYCWRYVQYYDFKDCSPTNGDCKTDEAWCGSSTPCNTSPFYELCSPGVPNLHCDSPFEAGQCRLGYINSCRSGVTCNGCAEARFDCWISWEPTPTSDPGPTSAPTPTPSPSCLNITFTPDPIDIQVGVSANVTATVNTSPPGSPVDRVEFSIVNPAIASIDDPPVPPHNDLTFPYRATVTGVSPGFTELRATAYMGGVAACGYGTLVDPVPADINVSNASSWWQVKNGDVIVNADIISPIPASCSLPVCDPAFIVTPLGGYPGIPSYAGGVFDVSSGIPPGTVSSTGWLAQASYNAQTDYNYAFFERLVPGDADRNVISVADTINPNYLKNQADSQAPSPDGYFWFFRTGDLILRGEPTLASTKVILFVNGNLTIDGNIKINPGTGFFMAIASGNITVNPGVENPGGGFDLEGVFVTNGNFTTSSAGPETDDPIQIRGMVAAYGMVDPNKDLTDNSTTPAELFEYAPDLLFNIPPSLQLKRTRWKEVAP